MSKKYDIFGIESGCLDLNVCINEMPELNRGTGVTDLSWQGGGKVSSGIIASARLGAKCTISGIYGDDSYGRFCYEDFKRHGVNVSNVILDPGKTTSLDIVVAEKKSMTRTMLFYPGTCRRMTEADADWGLLKDSRYLFISGASEMTRRAVQVAKENGVEVFIDADGHSPELEAMIPDIDIFIGSEFVFDVMFPGAKAKGIENLEEECRNIQARGPRIAIFTFGEKGCAGVDENGFFTVPAFNVDVIDTVGAGDIFHGAFIAEYAQGKSARECALLASGTSAIKCTRIGGRAGIPTQDVLDKFIATGEIDYSEIDGRVAYYRKGTENI